MARPSGKRKKRASPAAPDATDASLRPGAPADRANADGADLLDAPPDATTARRTVWAIALFAALQLAIPLRYYLGTDLYDERFAWRMFSAVRVQTCEIEATEERGEVRTPLALYSFLPAPWVGLLQRNRPAVVRAFLEWRCEGQDDEPPAMVSLRSACLDATGDPIPAITRELSCDDGVYTEREGEDAP